MPEFFRRLITELGAPPADIAHVGDRLDFDVLPSRAAGLYAVHIRRGPWRILFGDEAGDAADVQIDSLSEFTAALAGARSVA